MVGDVFKGVGDLVSRGTLGVVKLQEDHYNTFQSKWGLIPSVLVFFITLFFGYKLLPTENTFTLKQQVDANCDPDEEDCEMKNVEYDSSWAYLWTLVIAVIMGLIFFKLGITLGHYVKNPRMSGLYVLASRRLY
jgi:hypothetical protein